MNDTHHEDTLPSNTDLTPGQYLQEKRLRCGYSIRQLAKETGFSASYITRVEHGDRELNSMSDIILFASTLHFPVGELIQLTGLSASNVYTPVRLAFPGIQTSHQEAVISQFANLITSGTLSEEQMDQMIFNATAFKEYCQKCK